MFESLKRDIELRQIRESEERILESMILESDATDFEDEIMGDDIVEEDPELEKIIDSLPENTSDEPPTKADIDNAVEETPDPSIDELAEAFLYDF